MTTINNFDKSSTGVDIEFTGCYDLDRYRWLFDESLEVLRHSGYREFSILYYKDCGNVGGDDDVEFELKGTKSQLSDYLVDYFGQESKSGYMRWSKDELYNDVYNHIYDEMNLKDYRECNKELHEYGLEIVPTKELVWLDSRGYSQGDYAEVVYCPSDLKESWGICPEESKIQKEINNLLWDSPISATLTVNGNEYYYDEHFDWYEWQREKFIEYVAKDANVDKELLEAIVPENLKYN